MKTFKVVYLATDGKARVVDGVKALGREAVVGYIRRTQIDFNSILKVEEVSDEDPGPGGDTTPPGGEDVHPTG